MPIKPEELADAFEFAYGVKPDEVESIDKAKEHFQSRAVLRDQAHKDEAIIGKVFGAAETKVKSLFGDFLGDAESEARLKFSQAKSFTEKLEIIGKTVKEKTSAEIEELKKKVGSAAPELKAKYESEIEEWKNKYATIKQAQTEAVEGIKQWETRFQEREKDFKVQHLLNDVRSKVDIDPTLSSTPQGKMILKGFESEFFSKYKPDLSEDGNTLVFIEKATGKPKANPKRAGDFLSAEEIFAEEIKAAGIEKKSPSAGARIPFGASQQQQPGNQPQVVKNKVRRVY